MKFPPSGKVPLFRPEVAAAKRGDWLGNPFQPTSNWLKMSGVLLSVAVLLAIGLTAFVEYTRTVKAPGLILPQKGQNRIFMPTGTRLVRSCVSVGQVVEAGGCILVVTKARSLHGDGVPSIDDSQITALSVRAKLLRQERLVLAEELADTTTQLDATKLDVAEELEKISNIEKAQAPKLKFTDDQYRAHEDLARQGFISSEALRQKINERYDLERSSAELARDKVKLLRGRRESEFNLRSNARTIKTRLAEIDRQTEELNKEILEAQANVEQMVVSQRRSLVTALFVHEGDYASDTVAVLLSEAGDNLEVNYWVDSSVIPYLKEGDNVRVAFKAFPVQRFGYVNAKVTSWSQANPDPEDVQMKDVLQEKKGAGTFYRFRASLDAEQHGSRIPIKLLKPGMDVEVMVSTERLSIFRWLMDPLARIANPQIANTGASMREQGNGPSVEPRRSK